MKGSSLIELIITISIVVLVIAAAIPSIKETRSSLLRYEGRQILEDAVMNTQAQAVSNGGRGILIFSADGSSFSIGIDFSPYNDPVVEDNVIHIVPLPTGITALSSETIVYNSQGFLIHENNKITSTTFTLKQNETSYCIGSIYSLGTVEFNC